MAVQLVEMQCGNSAGLLLEATDADQLPLRSPHLAGI
jgi:hypothetical protein